MDLNQRKLLAVAILQHRLKARHRRRRWEHERNKARTQVGQYQRLLHELRLDSARFQRYFRLTVEQFDVLLQRLGQRMTGVVTDDRKPISSSQRLSICLWYLTSGDSYESIAYSFRVGVSTVGDIVLGVSQAIFDCLLNEFMPVPKEADWRAIAEDFLEFWNFPNCIGAVDGKHVIIKPPASSGSLYYNYKGSFSIVLMAVVDARCRFRLLDVGAHGRSSDKGLLSNSLFGQALRTAKLSIPPDKHLPGAEHLGSLPHVFVGDEAFPLLRNLLRPYPGKNLSREHRLYNYRLSRARNLVKYAFSLLASQFQIFQRAMDIEPVAAELFVRTACILHNFMRWDLTEDIPTSISDDEASDGLLPVQRLGSNNSSRKSFFIRNKFAEYFSSPAGAVPWQQDD